mgnify:CR=1 FL=1
MTRSFRSHVEVDFGTYRGFIRLSLKIYLRFKMSRMDFKDG